MKQQRTTNRYAPTGFGSFALGQTADHGGQSSAFGRRHKDAK